MDEQTIRDWHDKLHDLLTRAASLAGTGSGDERRALADEIQRFIMDKPMPRSGEAGAVELKDMDQIAIKARDDLRLAIVSDRISAIAGRSAEFASLTAKVRDRAAVNDGAAKAIRLERSRKVVAAVTDSVNAIEELKEQIEQQALTEESLRELKKKLLATAESLKALKASVEGGG